MIEEYSILKPLIKNWIHDERYMYSEKTFLPIEVHLSASSIVRKDFTMNRIRNLISKHNFNLKVFEGNTMEYSDRFIISK